MSFVYVFHLRTAGFGRLAERRYLYNMNKTLLRHTYYIMLSALTLLAGGAAVSCDDDETPPEPEPLTNFDEDYWGASPDSAITGAASDVTYYSAQIQGRLYKSPSKLPQFSQYGIAYATNDDPQPNLDPTVLSKRKTELFTVEVSGLDMGTRYYYRAFLIEGKGAKAFLGRVFYFTTQDCNTRVVTATDRTAFQATLHAETGINLSDSRFKGEYGFLITDRNTDKPSLEVDQIVPGTVNDLEHPTNFVGLADDLKPGTKYIYQAFVKIDDQYYWSTNVESFSTLPLNIATGEIAIDMGGTVGWCTHNVGASAAQDPGGFYPWGDPTGQITTSNCADLPMDYVNICGTEYDMAQVNMGGDWHLPTFEQFRELVDDCRWNWTEWQGRQGYCVYSDKTKQSIFLPAGGYIKILPNYGDPTRKEMGGDQATPMGYYWTGSLCADIGTNNKAYNVYIGPEDSAAGKFNNIYSMHKYSEAYLYNCFMVRAVKTKTVTPE